MMEKSPYCFIVGACSKYTIELCVLLNSLDYVGNKQDVHILGIQLDEKFTAQFSNVSYKIIHHNISEEEFQASRGISEVTCRKRYWYAAEIGKDYKAICVLDADLIFSRDPIQFFNIAEKTGYILGVNKEQNKVYDDPHHETNGKWEWKNVTKGFWNDKDLCNCPLFIDTKIWGEALKKSWDIFLNQKFRAPDMCAMNLCLLEAGAHDKIITLANIQWLSTNETALKPYWRITERRDKKLWTENGLEIFSYHGHYGHSHWRKTQLDNRHRCAEGYLGCSFNTDNMARGVMELLYKNFKKMLNWKIKIAPFNYRHPELDYKKDYGNLWD